MSPISEIGRVTTGRAPSVKIPWAYSHSYLCGCFRPASGHTLRGDQRLNNGLIKSTPLTSTWPHLRRDVGLEEGEY